MSTSSSPLSKPRILIKHGSRDSVVTKTPSKKSLSSPSLRLSNEYLNKSAEKTALLATMEPKREVSRRKLVHQIVMEDVPPGGYFFGTIERWLGLRNGLVSFENIFVPLSLKFANLAALVGVQLVDNIQQMVQSEVQSSKEMHEVMVNLAFYLSQAAVRFSVNIINFLFAPPTEETDMKSVMQGVNRICYTVAEGVKQVLKTRNIFEIHSSIASKVLKEIEKVEKSASELSNNFNFESNDLNVMLFNLLKSVLDDLILLESSLSNVLHDLVSADGLDKVHMFEVMSACYSFSQLVLPILKKASMARKVITETKCAPCLGFVPESSLDQQLVDQEKQNCIWNSNPITKNPTNGIMSGTIPEIVFTITDPEHGGELHKPIVSTFSAYMSAQEFLSCIITRLTPPDSKKNTEYARNVQLRTITVLRWWIKNSPFDFDAQIVQKIRRCTTLLTQEDAKMFLDSVDKILHRAENMNVILPQNLPNLNIQVPDRVNSSLGIILGVPDILIAHQLVSISSQLFVKILPTEFLQQAWCDEKLKHRATNIIAFIERANYISKWVTTCILSGHTPEIRARLIKRFLKIAKHLHSLRDFNSLMGMIVGIGTSSVERIRKSWALLNDKHIEGFQKLSDLMSPEKSFSRYRDHIATIDGPFIPFLGVYLSDLVFMNEGNPTYLNPEKTILNITKQELVYSVITKMHTYQVSNCCMKTMQKMEPLYTLLQTLPHLNESMLYELSLWMEPREQVAKFPPILSRGGFSKLQSQGFTQVEVGEMIELIVNDHLEDPRWVYVSRNVEKRKQVMRGAFGHTVRWCSKQSNNTFVKYARRSNPNESKKICAVAVFLEPNSSIKAPITTLMVELGKILVQTGTKVANRVKTLVKGIEDFSESYEPPNCWEFFYFSVDPAYKEDRDYWEEIIWGVLNKADKKKEVIWTYFTEQSRIEYFKHWGFTIFKESFCVEGKIPIWGAVRQPQVNNWESIQESTEGTIFENWGGDNRSLKERESFLYDKSYLEKSQYET